MKPIFLLLVAVTALVTGCANMFAASYNYNVAVKNVGKENLWCSLVASTQGIAHEPGLVVPGKSKTFAGPFKRSYADKWTVDWKTAKGEEVVRTLDLTHKFPKKFEGRLVFTIDANNNLSFIIEPFSGK